MSPRMPLATLTALWLQQLSSRAADGSLLEAANQAFAFTTASKALIDLLQDWSQGEFRHVPPVVLLPSAHLSGAAGAYASSTGSIYLSDAWLHDASISEALAVLNEELGHHLDALLKSEDSAGDEGAIFSRVLNGEALSQDQITLLRQENDHGRIRLNDSWVEAEFHNGIVHVPANAEITGTQKFTITSKAFRGDVSLEGLNRYAVQFILDDTTHTTDQGKQQQLSAFEGSKASITLELAADKAPKTVENFLGYLQNDFYKDTIFHRVINGFVVQGGGFDVTTFAQKTPQKPIFLESTLNSGLSNLRGTLAMARTTEPDSATSQFFFNTVDNLSLNYKSELSPGYAVFAAIREGMEVVDAISKAPQRSTISATGGAFANITEPVVKITTATLLPRPTLANFKLVASAHYGNVQLDEQTGSFIYSPSYSSAIDDTFTYSISIPARDGLPARSITRTVDLWADNPIAPATAEKDLIVGRESKDTYVIPDLRSSTYEKPDRIINYQTIDTIDAPGEIAITLTKELGAIKIKSLDELSRARRSLGKVLSRKSFKSNQIAAVQIKKSKRSLGTAIAFNDGKAGFDPINDGLIILENFNIAPGNSINII